MEWRLNNLSKTVNFLEKEYITCKTLCFYYNALSPWGNSSHICTQ